MALLNSLFSGVSGLRNHQAMMDVIGNNIANVNTIGYKGSRITFSDTFNQMIKAGTNPTDGAGGTNSMQVGLGMKVNSIDRNWNQGTFERTGITTDLALQGPGLFILNNNGTQQYSRAGAFIFDANGTLVNPQNGAVVQGKVANGLGEIPAGNSVQDIVIDKNLRLPAIATQNISWGGNLESSSPTLRTDIVEMSGSYKSDDIANAAGTDQQTYVIYGGDGTEYQLVLDYENTAYDGTTTPPTNAAYTVNYEILDKAGNPLSTPLTGTQALSFDSITNKNTTSALNIIDSSGNINFDLNFNALSTNTSPTEINTTIDKNDSPEEVTGTVTIYDTLGNAHSLTIKYTHIDNNSWAWEVEAPATGELTTAAPYQPNGVIKFKPGDGTIESIKQGDAIISTLPSISFQPTNGTDAMPMQLDFGVGTNGITQTALSSQVAALSQDGSAASSLANLNIDQYGNIVGIFSNGTSQALAQVMVATFPNLNGLVSIGDNMYQVAANAGDPRIGEPGESSTTTIQSGALEQSNVDLSEEFTKMIVSQRGFQANARVVTTADALLQEITNLIR
ncbi:MAG: flagellar biosynthesis protein FlgE [Ignavibacteriales bacterium CG18_big_fil_WC_8_21_14_2_50_31_20]|nr:MAG: flagellar biosynthesis protein FlgE [Ignavibacteriales bacterium CG18_big_fil_WC_8_21_14_2_50_31_20]